MDIVRDSDIQIVRACTGPEIAGGRELVEEYASWLRIDLTYQNFAKEIESFPGSYAAPLGAVIVARAGARYVGCVCLRPLSADIAELKRLYVRTEARAKGLGRHLSGAAIRAAREAGYRDIYLDTLPTMTAARALYEALGFVPIDAYYEGAPQGTVFLGLTL